MSEGFSNAIIGGAETLIRSAIKSVNYVLGLTGWRITRDGDAELNDATVRGTITAGNGNVVVNSGGISVKDITLAFEYLINRSAGFIARNNPDNGAHTQMFVDAIVMTLPTVSAHGFASTFGRYDITGPSVGTEDFFQSNMVTGTINGGDDANVLCKSEGSAGTPPYIQLDTTATGTVEITAEFTVISNRLIDNRSQADYAATIVGVVSTASLPIGTTSFVISGIALPISVPGGSAHYVINLTVKDANPGNASLWSLRTNNETANSFDIVGTRPSATAGSAITLNIGYVLTIF